MLRILAVGDWGPDEVAARLISSSRPIIPEIERIIDEEWSAHSKRPGIHLFDGPMARWESCDVSPRRLRIELSQTSYKPFLGTNLMHPELADRYGKSVLANPVGVSPALLTADGFLLMGRRNSSVAYYPSRIHPFAGAMDPRDKSDVFAAVRRELMEELALSSPLIQDLRCTGIAEDPALRQPELIFFARCGLTRRQIDNQLDPEEHHQSVSVPATCDAVECILIDPALTPVAVASLILWGRLEFGEEWFDQIVKWLKIDRG
jgi:hypothetical protein